MVIDDMAYILESDRILYRRLSQTERRGREGASHMGASWDTCGEEFYLSIQEHNFKCGFSPSWVEPPVNIYSRPGCPAEQSMAV